MSLTCEHCGTMLLRSSKKQVCEKCGHELCVDCITQTTAGSRCPRCLTTETVARMVEAVREGRSWPEVAGLFALFDRGFLVKGLIERLKEEGGDKYGEIIRNIRSHLCLLLQEAEPSLSMEARCAAGLVVLEGEALHGSLEEGCAKALLALAQACRPGKCSRACSKVLWEAYARRLERLLPQEKALVHAPVLVKEHAPEGLTLRGMTIRGLEAQDLTLARLDMREVTFEQTLFRNVTFKKPSLSRCTFKAVTFDDCELENPAALEGCIFHSSTIRNLEAKEAHLGDCVFESVALLGGDLAGVHLAATRWTASRIVGPDLKASVWANAQVEADEFVPSRFDDVQGECASFGPLGSLALSKGNEVKGGSFVRSLWRNLSLGAFTFVDTDFSEARFLHVTFRGRPFHPNCDLSLARMEDCSFLPGVNLQGVRFDEVSFMGTELLRADLREAMFRGSLFEGLKGLSFRECDMREAIFSDMDLEAMLFEGCDLRGARFEKCRIPASCTFSAATRLDEALFEDCQIDGLKLAPAFECPGLVFRNCEITDLTLTGTFNNITLQDTREPIVSNRLTRLNLQGSILKGGLISNLTLEKAQLAEIIWELVQLRRVVFLSCTNWRKAVLRGCSFEKVEFEGCAGANLSEAHLEGGFPQAPRLPEVRLEGARLKALDLTGADLSEGWMEGAELDDVSLAGANLSHLRANKARLTGCFLDRALVEGLSLEGATLERCSFPMLRSDGQGVHLRLAKIKGANDQSMAALLALATDITSAELEEVSLDDLTLQDRDLSLVSFKACSIKGGSWERVRMDGAQLIQGTVFAPSYSVGLSLVRGLLEDCRLGLKESSHPTIMEDADLLGSTLRRVSVRNVVFRKGRLRSCRVQEPPEFLARVEGTDMKDFLMELPQDRAAVTLTGYYRGSWLKGPFVSAYQFDQLEVNGSYTWGRSAQAMARVGRELLPLFQGGEEDLLGLERALLRSEALIADVSDILSPKLIERLEGLRQRGRELLNGPNSDTKATARELTAEALSLVQEVQLSPNDLVGQALGQAGLEGEVEALAEPPLLWLDRETLIPLLAKLFRALISPGLKGRVRVHLERESGMVRVSLAGPALLSIGWPVPSPLAELIPWCASIQAETRLPDGHGWALTGDRLGRVALASIHGSDEENSQGSRIILCFALPSSVPSEA